MSHRGGRWIVALAVLALSSALGPAEAQSRRLDRARIEEVTGLKGTFNEQEGVFKVTSARTDVEVGVDGWKMPPFMGLTSWASFKAGQPGKFMVMGDLVLFQDEVNPVLGTLLDAGIDVTALHNHFFFDDPRVYFMHIEGEGGQEPLARAVRAALDRVKEIRTATPRPAAGSSGTPLPKTNAITGKPIEDILGATGQARDGMLKVVIGRTARAACGCEVAQDMGVNSWAAFAGTDDNAVVDGDVAMREDELQGVLKALRKAKIDVVAIHNHMTKEDPRLVFLHYWGRGRADVLARGLRSALDTQKTP
jgi:hypothetical protein